MGPVSHRCLGVDGTVVWQGFVLESEETMKKVKAMIQKRLEKARKRRTGKRPRETGGKTKPPRRRGLYVSARPTDAPS